MLNADGWFYVLEIENEKNVSKTLVWRIVFVKELESVVNAFVVMGDDFVSTRWIKEDMHNGWRLVSSEIKHESQLSPEDLDIADSDQIIPR